MLYGDKGYMFHKGSNVAKKIDAWIQKEMTDSQYFGRTHSSREERELPEIGIDYGFIGRDRRCVADLACQVSKQFNWMLGCDSC